MHLKQKTLVSQGRAASILHEAETLGHGWPSEKTITGGRRFCSTCAWQWLLSPLCQGSRFPTAKPSLEVSP